MNALSKAQARYDNMQPDDDSGFDEAAGRWIEESAANLMKGCDLVIRQRNRAPIVVSYTDYLVKVQQHLNKRQEDGEDQDDFFAQLVLAALDGRADKEAAGGLIGPGETKWGKRYDIAVDMVSPHAESGLIAQREDDEL